MERIRFGSQPPVHPGARPDLAARTITAGPASRELRMTGWRAGRVTGPEQIMADTGLAGLTSAACQAGIARQAAAALTHPGAGAGAAAATRIWQQRCELVPDQLAGYPPIRPRGG
jgi:aspartate/methionine/tyrosine aminotransferase